MLIKEDLTPLQFPINSCINLYITTKWWSLCYLFIRNTLTSLWTKIIIFIFKKYTTIFSMLTGVRKNCLVILLIITFLQLIYLLLDGKLLIEWNWYNFQTITNYVYKVSIFLFRNSLRLSDSVIIPLLLDS